ncbi:MAG: hypothetical protein WC532_08750 [Candidatus Omnitrophota bacterium]
MFLRKKGQSTAEYAIVIGLVIAVAAGILQVALKGGIRQKNKQATDYLVGENDGTDGGAGGYAAMNAQIALGDPAELYTQEMRDTTVLGGDANYVDESVMLKGGAEERRQKQVTETTAVSVEAIEGVTTGN